MMNGNYEAQSHFTRERLASRREQAAAERFLRKDRPAPMSGLKQLLVRLFRRLGQLEEKKRFPQNPPAAREDGKRSKGKFA